MGDSRRHGDPQPTLLGANEGGNWLAGWRRSGGIRQIGKGGSVESNEPPIRSQPKVTVVALGKRLDCRDCVALARRPALVDQLANGQFAIQRGFRWCDLLCDLPCD